MFNALIADFDFFDAQTFYILGYVGYSNMLILGYPNILILKNIL